MNDTDLLNWFEINGISFSEPSDTIFRLEWLDPKGIPRVTFGSSLRDCIRAAASGCHIY